MINQLKNEVKILLGLNRKQKKEYLIARLKQMGYAPNVQRFKNSVNKIGYNVLVEKGEGKAIVISAHYDGIGAYDNNSGVVILLNLMEEFKNHYFNNKIIFAFFDLEELFNSRKMLESGSKYFLKNCKNQQIIENINIDGIGIGKDLINIEKGRIEKLFGIFCDADVFKSAGIKAESYSTIDKEEKRILENEGKMPESLKIVHTKDDDLAHISQASMRFAANELYSRIVAIDAN